MNSKDVTVILPIHSVDGKFDEWFSKAIKSLEQTQVKPGYLTLVCADDNKIDRDWETTHQIYHLHYV